MGTKKDRGTLLACLLVCRSWHTYAIRFLYEPLHIFSRKELVRLADTARGCHVVRRRLSGTHTIFLVQSGHKPEITHLLPLMLGAYLPNLQHMYLMNFLPEVCNPGFFTMMRKFSLVTHLLLFRFSLSTFGDFRRMICALPCLDKLELRSGGFQSQTVPLYASQSESRSVPSFTQLILNRVESRFAEALVQWMTSHDMHWDIRSLEIAHDFYYRPDFGKKPSNGIIDDLSVLCASTAEHLHLQNAGDGMCSARRRPWLMATDSGYIQREAARIASQCSPVFVALKSDSRLHEPIDR